MILGKIKDLEKYVYTLKNGKELLDFVKNTDFSTLPYGVTEIKGKDLFVNFMTYKTSDDIGVFEAHRDYIDLQLIVKGEERIDYADLSDATTTIEYNPNKDAEFLSAEKFSSLYLKDGYFAIFFPEDAHRPSLTYKEKTDVIKAVFKIKV